MKIDAWWRLAGWALVVAIVWASLTPHPVDNGLPQGDKLNHLLGYGAVMFWFAQLRVRRLRLALWLTGLGAAMEIVQSFTSYREADAVDALANAAGVAAGWFAARHLPNLRERLAALLASGDSRL